MLPFRIERHRGGHRPGQPTAERGHRLALRTVSRGRTGLGLAARGRPGRVWTALLLQRLWGEQASRLLAIRWLMAPLLDGCHEAVAPTVQSVDKPLFLPNIARGATDRFNARVQRRLAHNLLGPEMLQQLLLGDNAVAVHNEIGQHIEHLGSHLDWHTRSAQLIALGVKRIVPKHIAHCPPSRLDRWPLRDDPRAPVWSLCRSTRHRTGRDYHEMTTKWS